MVTKPNRPTFLTLPLEIRNHIYEYLLIFNISPLPPPPDHLSYWIDIPKPALDLSILRVNKQIYDEASRVLYSHNVFPVRIKTMGGSFRDRDDNLVFYDVTYQTLWETIQYRNALPWDKPPRYYHDTQHGSFPFYRLPASDISLPPFKQYRHLLRRFHIAIIDLSVYAASECFQSDTVPEDPKYRKLSKSMLMPFVTTRLKELLHDCQGNANVKVEVYPEFLHPSPRRHGPIPYDEFTPDVVSSIHPVVFKDLAYLVHPLTIPKWKWNVKVRHPAGERFEEYMKDAWEECDGDEGWSEGEMGSFGEMELDVGYTWAIEEGRLVAIGEWANFPRGPRVCEFPGILPPRVAEEQDI
ncbi:hypothetical protein TWF694_001772 [Orbilia ellipsospora]|uniref:F-box domain-containing protein n=1 Tax=Orbilia ellipsospora TaxID=2528407 RepID=A0AAV9X4S2_9PEZI